MYYRYFLMLVVVILIGPIQRVQAYDSHIAFRGGERGGFERPEFNRGEEFNRGDINRDEYVPYDARGNSFRRGGAAAWGMTRGYEAGQINEENAQYYDPYMYYFQPYSPQQQPYQQQQGGDWQQSSSSPN